MSTIDNPAQYLNIPYIAELNVNSAMEDISNSLDQLGKNPINVISWPEYAYAPKVGFSIAHANDCIFIKYYIREEFLRITHVLSNEPVYKDSCVEFFIAFNGEKEYYNLEFNAIGTCLFHFGSDRNERVPIPPAIISNITHLATLRSEPDNETGMGIFWSLTLKIPVDVFVHHQLNSLAGHEVDVNFYKCGDDLPIPHYLSWKKVETQQPDFHVRGCFGKAVFQ